MRTDRYNATYRQRAQKQEVLSAIAEKDAELAAA